jgi:menaquinone-dependent protoporphyrinogen IX oxidase
MKGVIIYRGKYGATRQYAEWLGEELNLSLLSSERATDEQISDCNYLLIGTSVYFGKFKIRSWLKKNVGSIRKKELFLFVVNATDSEEMELRSKFIYDNVPMEIMQHLQIFFLPGRIIHKQLSLTHKIIFKIAGAFIKDPKKRQALKGDLNGVKREHILPITKAVNYFCSLKQSSE